MLVKTIDLLSLTSGVLVGSFSDMQGLAEKLCGHPVWTHQLPGLFGPIRKHVEESVPFIGTLISRIDALGEGQPCIDEANRIVASIGETIDIPPMNSTPVESAG